jgi:uncharacterized membrane protein
MSGLLEWAGENPYVSIPAIVFGSVFGVGLVVSLAAISPFALTVLASLVFFVWLIVRTGALVGDDRSESEPEPDPTTELERRYVRGEISEKEFEHRLSVVLDADELVGRESNTEREVALER